MKLTARAVLVLVLIGLTTGCMTFNGSELPKRELPDPADTRPVIATEVGEIKVLHNGESGLKPPMSAHGIGKRALNAVLTRWKGKKLVSDYGPPGKLDRDPDLTLAISGTQDEESSILGAVATGVTLFLFPSSATLRWDWHFELTNHSTGQEFEVDTKNSVTQWMHLVFLPAFPFSIVGQMRADRGLSHYVYSELAKQGAWGGEEFLAPKETAAPGDAE